MKKQIIVNTGDLESRVAIMEDGQLAELTVEREARLVGSIYKARVMSVLPGMDAAFADIGIGKNVFLCADDVGFVSKHGITSLPAPRSATISDRLKEGQEVVVQIIRAPVGSKGARATTRLALPGRYLVLMLSEERQIGVSRKIDEGKERERLRKIAERLRPKAMGLIVRTEAEGHGKKDLTADLKVLLDLRQRILDKAAKVHTPTLLHQDLTLTYQVIRDVFTADVQRLVIDSRSAYNNAVELVESIAPRLRRRVKLYRGKLPIFHKYGVEGEIDRLLRRRVWLPAGGYISIDQAEAFTAIDVNTGRFTGTTGLADTILRTNLEAAEEIARQLRLRDVGGIIVLDFIDMERASHRQQVMRAFEAALERDRQKTKIVRISPLGLMEMTRKRRGESLMGTLTETCPQCGGLGRVRQRLTIALRIERELGRMAVEDSPPTIIVRTAPSVAGILVGEEGARVSALEKKAGLPIYIRADEGLGVEEHEMMAMAKAKAAERFDLHKPGDEIVIESVDLPENSAPEERYGWCGGLRLKIASTKPVKESEILVIEEVGHSFARGYVKGAKPVKKTAEEGKKKPARRARRPRGKQAKPAPSATEKAREKPPEDTGQKRTPQRGRPRRKREERREDKLEQKETRPRTKSTRRSGRKRKPARAEKGSAGKPAVAQTPRPEIKEEAPAPVRKRVGLLRRGARSLLRGRH